MPAKPCHASTPSHVIATTHPDRPARSFFGAVVTGACTILLATGVAAQTQRPIRIVVPFPGGNVIDSVARILAEPMSQILGQPVVVENRPGGAGTIGTEHVARAPADGHTLLYTGLTTIVDAFLHAGRPPLDPTRDFTPIGIASRSGFVLVSSPATGIASIADLIAKAKSAPGSLTYASVGEGTVNHLLTARFAKLAGISLTHVPYKESWYPDLIAGRVAFMIGATGSATPFVRSGKLNALITLSPERVPALPDVPTAKEAGVSYLTFSASQSMFAPGTTPSEIVGRYNSALNAALRDSTVRKRYGELGIETAQSTLEEAVANIKAQAQEFDEMRLFVFGKSR